MILQDVSCLIFDEKFDNIIIANKTEQIVFKKGQSYDLSLYYDQHRKDEINGIIQNNKEKYLAIEIV